MPPLREFRIRGYRSFSEEEVFNPAIPTVERCGSGITWIVGPNNAGKSSLLEGIDICSCGQDVTLERAYRNKSTIYRSRLSATWTDGRQVTLESDPANPIRLVARVSGGEKKTSQPHRPVYISSITRIPTQIASNPRAGIEALLHGNAPTSQNRQERPSFLTQRMAKWLQPNARALELFRQIVDFDVNLYPEGERLNVEVLGNEHPPEGLGTGVATVAHIVDAIYELPPGSTLMIDEPEQRLHPSYQRRLLRVLLEEARRIQIILCTHSPFLIDWNALQMGAKLVRMSRSEESYSKIFELSATTIESIEPLFRDLFNPHVFGINATEFLFLPDQIVLVEGQEDVIFLQRSFEEHQLRIAADFYGWGVGGAEKMKRVAKVLFELGFRRVVGLLDRDKLEVAKQMAREFPSYRFITLPTDDIRDKPAVQKPSKHGLFRRDGTLAPHEPELLRSICIAINAAITDKGTTGEPIVLSG